MTATAQGPIWGHVRTNATFVYYLAFASTLSAMTLVDTGFRPPLSPMVLDSPRSDSAYTTLLWEQEVGGSNPGAPTSIDKVLSESRGGSGVDRGQSGAGCATDLPFDRAPSDRPIERYSGAVWLSWPGGTAAGAIISEDDHGRTAKGFRNRWRYTITGPPAVGLAVGCSARWVEVRVIPGGAVTVAFDGALRLVIVPGDPDLQARFAKNAGVCEGNLQFVDVQSVDGRWRITIEEPAAMPETRTFCR